jgi:hypothetical protein
MTIHYVCISDMHLGQDNSLLTNLATADAALDHSDASPVLKALCTGLRELIGLANAGADVKPALILNGDILELALANVNDAAMVFRRFLGCLMPKGEEIFSDLLYVPGNHDHHLWEMARETQYVEYLKDSFPDPLPAPWHTTSLVMADNPLSSYFLNGVIRHYDPASPLSVKIAYPNLAIRDRDRQRYAIFSHGHYIESIYLLMTEAISLLFPDRKKPVTIWDFEEENFAWIDFFWSVMGRSGAAGSKVEAIYEALPVEKARNRLIANLCASLAQKYDLPGWGDWIEEKLLEKILIAVADHFANNERRQTEGVLSDDARKGLWRYMEGPLYRQLLDFLKKDQSQSDEKKVVFPRAVTFVFGHTHKPYQEEEDFGGYPVWVDVYNTGGWVVESVAREPIKGASVVLFDEDLHSTALRLYNEADSASGFQVRVAQAAPQRQDAAGNQFHAAIQDLVMNKMGATWADFSQEASRAVDIRAKHLKAKLARTAA